MQQRPFARRRDPLAADLPSSSDRASHRPCKRHRPNLRTRPRASFPPQIRYIIGNEGCERFSFYGMRNILTPFLVSTARCCCTCPEGPSAPGAAKEVFHTFVIGVYFFPLLGGWIADRILGKYRTILWLLAGVLHRPVLPGGCSTTTSTASTPAWRWWRWDRAASSRWWPRSWATSSTSRTSAWPRIAFDAFYWIINFGSCSPRC
jgi:POT family proton-dependent oligopeptide transporter